MCTIIVTIRTVLWYVMSLAGTLMILVALFTNRWLHGRISSSNFSSGESIMNTALDAINAVGDGTMDLIEKDAGLFLDCKTPAGKKFFEGECIPDWRKIEQLYTNLDDDQYPHAWRGAVICFALGLGIMVIVDVFALLTVCCRSCLCCSVFTVCGSLQSFAGILFTLGLVAYPAGWGARVVKQQYCGGESNPFILGSNCSIGGAFWLAVAGTVCTLLASSLAIWAYQSTKSARCEERQAHDDKCICLP